MYCTTPASHWNSTEGWRQLDGADANWYVVLTSDPLLSTPSLLQAVEPKVEEVKQEMALLYPQATVDEWVEQHISAVVAPLHSLLKDLQLAMEDMGLHAPVPPSGW